MTDRVPVTVVMEAEPRHTVEAERACAVAHIRARVAGVRVIAKRGTITEAEGGQLSRWLTALADEIGDGQHVGE